MASEDERSVGELFAELPEKWQRALTEVGMGLPELRRVAEGPDGMRRVRRILADVTSAPGARGKGAGSAVWPWARLLLVAVVSTVVCLLCTPAIGKGATFVGLVLGLLVFWVASKARLSRGGLVAVCLTLAAYLVLVSVGSYFANAWYLQVRGVQQTVTLASPTHQWTHGTRETYCRVRLRDGSVHEVVDNKGDCADRVGQKVTAVVDPADHYKPSLGTKSDVGGVLEGYVCLGAGVILVLAPLTAAVMGRRNRAGERRLSGTAA